ncbi:MAG: ABC-2 family transporter protein [Thermomicrobiales bacterium]
MRIYLELAVRSFRQVLTYRGATLAGLFTNAIFGVIIASTFIGFYGAVDGGSVRGWSEQQTLTLMWISQSILMVMFVWGWWKISRTIQTGAIAMDMLKPVNFIGYWLARDLGRAAAQMIVRFVPTFIIGNLLYNLLAPPSLANGLAFGMSLALGVVVSFGWRFLLNTTSFWLVDHRGINYLALAAMNILSGLLIPLAFLPDPILTVVNLLPLRAIVMIPGQIYLGQIPIAEGLAIQLFWAVVLLLLGSWVLSRGEKKVVVQGG